MSGTIQYRIQPQSKITEAYERLFFTEVTNHNLMFSWVNIDNLGRLSTVSRAVKCFLCNTQSMCLIILTQFPWVIKQSFLQRFKHSDQNHGNMMQHYKCLSGMEMGYLRFVVGKQ